LRVSFRFLAWQAHKFQFFWQIQKLINLCLTNWGITIVYLNAKWIWSKRKIKTLIIWLHGIFCCYSHSSVFHGGATNHREIRVSLWIFLNRWLGRASRETCPMRISLGNGFFSSSSLFGKHPFSRHLFSFSFTLPHCFCKVSL
jgi:hypothetical protein